MGSVGTVRRVLLYPKEADFHLRQGASPLRPADSSLTGLSSTSTGREACLLQHRNKKNQKKTPETRNRKHFNVTASDRHRGEVGARQRRFRGSDGEAAESQRKSGLGGDVSIPCFGFTLSNWMFSSRKCDCVLVSVGSKDTSISCTIIEIHIMDSLKQFNVSSFIFVTIDFAFSYLEHQNYIWNHEGKMAKIT